jgi:hypothetical protein
MQLVALADPCLIRTIWAESTEQFRTLIQPGVVIPPSFSAAADVVTI